MAIVDFIQQVTITIAANATSATATIATVNQNNASEHYGGIIGAETTYNASTDQASLVLTDPNTVTATRNTADASNAVTLTGTIIQWLPGTIKSIQRGSILMSAVASATATITAITLANSAVQFNGSQSTYTGAAQPVLECSVNAASTTSISAQRTTGTNDLTAFYTAIEANSGIFNSSTQQITGAIAASTTSKAVTITSVTAANSMLIYGGWVQSSTSVAFDSVHPWATITNGTTVTWTRLNGGSPISTGYCTVVEMKAADIKSTNRGSMTIAINVTTATVTITAVNTVYTIANWLGKTSNSATTSEVFNKTYNNLVLTNTTTGTLTRNTSDATITSTGGYEFIEFAPLIEVFSASDARFYRLKNENFLYPSIFDCPHIPAFFNKYFQDAWAIPDSVPYYKKPINWWTGVQPIYQSNPGTIGILYGDAWEVSNQVRYYPRPNFWWTQLPEKYEANPANIGIFYAGAWEVNNQVRYYPQRNYWWSELPEIMQFEPGSIGILFTAAWTTQIVTASRAAKNFGFLQATPVIGLDPTHVVIDEFIIRARRRGRR